MNRHFLFMWVLCMLIMSTLQDTKVVTLSLTKRSKTRRNLEDSLSSGKVGITFGVRPSTRVLDFFEELYETELLIGENKKKVKFVVDINSTYVAIDREDNERLLSDLDSTFQNLSQANTVNFDDQDSSGEENQTTYLEILNNKTLGTLTTQNVSMNSTHYWSMTVLEIDNSNKESSAKQPNVLGLSYRKAPYLVMPLIDHLWEIGLISTYSFSLDFDPSGDPKIIFGEDKRFNSKIAQGAFLGNSWYLKLSPYSDFYDNYQGGYVYAILSNTLSSIILTRKAFQSYMREINTDGQWGTSNYSGNTACYWDSIDDFPTLTIQSENTNSVFTIDAENYVIKDGDIWELLIDFIEDEEIEDEQNENEENEDEENEDEENEDTENEDEKIKYNVMFLGFPFFKQYYTNFDSYNLYAIRYGEDASEWIEESSDWEDYPEECTCSAFLSNANLLTLALLLSLSLIY